MKGDFSRIRFNPAKLYTAVLEQQGRVELDSDANEQRAIDVTLRQTTSADLIGPYGGPVNHAGFAISIVGENIWISPGRYYVNGILVEIPVAVDYDHQPYLIDPAHNAAELLDSLRAAGAGACLEFVLEVWQRMATALDEPCLLEPALSQADTTTRLQTVWRVIGFVSGSNRNLQLGRTGKMGAAPAGDGSGCGCQPIPAAGYQGMENQLYRVEIHQAGDLTSATFKWSRENGSVVTKITEVNGATVTVASLGPDANLGYQAGQWVELGDDTDQFGPTPNQPGTLYQIQLVTPAALQVTMTTPVTGIHKHKNARMRRWDQTGTSATGAGIPVSSTPVPLENGIVVDFSKGNFEAGDYWTIPARTANGTIDWPPCGGDGQHFQPASYMPIHQAPLASASVVTEKGAGLLVRTIAVVDMRSFFSPLAESAIHVEAISWANADMVSLDKFLHLGLNVGLDAAPTSVLDAAVFQVSLEIAGAGYGFYRQGDNVLANRMERFNNALPSGASAVDAAAKVNVFSVGAALRQQYVLDGIVQLIGPEMVGWLLSWNFPVNALTAETIYELNSLLANAAVSTFGDRRRVNFTPAARVRVRLLGHAIFAEPSDCGPAKTIYLDGQSFGKSSTLVDGAAGVGLVEPSGAGARATDFESWFYLAPVAAVDSVEFNPSAMTLFVGSIGGAAGPSSGTSTGTVLLSQPMATDTTIELTASTQAGVTLTLAPTSFVIKAGDTAQNFTVTVQATTAAPNGMSFPTVTATPKLAAPALGAIFAATGQLNVTVENPVAISTVSVPAGTMGRAYNTTLAATGGTPPYKWSLPSGPGSLPGVTLTPAGAITGFPQKAGEFPFTAQVTDSAGTAATASKQFTLEIYSPLQITTQSPLPSGYQEATYQTQLEATGGKPPYQWSKTAGSLTGDLAVNSNGVIAGANPGWGQSQFTVEVTDTASPMNAALKSFTIDIAEAPR